MKVLQVNTYVKGGAAAAAIRLHRGLLETDVDSTLLVQYPGGDMPRQSITFRQPPASTQQRIVNKFMRVANELIPQRPSDEYQFVISRNPRHELFSFPNSSVDITLSESYRDADIVNLHWVAGFLDYQSFFKKNKKPVVWTLHDMNAFSGGEHYSERYLGMNEKGEPAGRMLTSAEIAWEAKIMAAKVKALTGAENIYIVSPSKWLMDESKKSEVLNKFPHCCIPYGLPTEIFKPRDKHTCREILGLPKDKIIMLFVADSLGSFRKGYDFLKAAVTNISDERVLLCAVGGNAGLYTLPNVKELGRINDERMMSIVYGAADVFIIPSLMDNLPNTVLEALTCGIPVIGFRVGGIPDMVEEGVNGFLAHGLSVSALQNVIDHYLKNAAAFNRRQISLEASKKYSLHVQASAYRDLYNSILTNQ